MIKAFARMMHAAKTTLFPKRPLGDQWSGRNRQVIAIAAFRAEDGVIGVNNELPWHRPEDMAYFKQTTMGHTLLMGGATARSLRKPLPGRLNLVLCSDATAAELGAGFYQVRSIADALLRGPGDLYVIGGSKTYQSAKPFIDRYDLSVIRGAPPIPAGSPHAVYMPRLWG